MLSNLLNAKQFCEPILAILSTKQNFWTLLSAKQALWTVLRLLSKFLAQNLLKIGNIGSKFA